MNKNLHVFIVIPTFNRKNQLTVLLGQLKKQKLDGITVDTVVVVDGSTDGTLELLKTDFPETHVISGDGNWWFTRSLNEGCKYAIDVLKAQLILTLNDDVQLPDNYLREITRNFLECDENSIIGSSSYSLSIPRMLTFSGFKSENKLSLKYHRYVKAYTFMEPGELKGIARSITLPTRGLLIPAKILKDVNYLDEKTFPQYASDYDLVLKAAKRGVNVYVSYDAYVFEDMKLTSDGNPRLSKGLKNYLKNLFFNKYSSNYLYNRIIMSWRYGIKLLFPLYFIIALASIPYIYIKYRFFLNKKLNKS